MSGKTLKESILLAVLSVALVATVWSQLRSAQPAASGVLPSNPLAAAAKGAGDEGTVTDVRLDLLQSEAASFTAPRRDPFRYRPKPEPVRPAPAPVVYVPPPVPGPPPLERIDTKIRLIGVVELRPGVRHAALSDGTRTLTGFEGEIIEGRYRLLRIGSNFVEIAYLDGAGRVRLPLPGQ